MLVVSLVSDGRLQQSGVSTWMIKVREGRLSGVKGEFCSPRPGTRRVMDMCRSQKYAEELRTPLTSLSTDQEVLDKLLKQGISSTKP